MSYRNPSTPLAVQTMQYPEFFFHESGTSLPFQNSKCDAADFYHSQQAQENLLNRLDGLRNSLSLFRTNHSYPV
jgi:hypothetical protein